MATSNKKTNLLALQARELFTVQAGRVLPDLAKLVLDKLSVLVDQPGSAREQQDRRDTCWPFKPLAKCG